MMVSTEEEHHFANSGTTLPVYWEEAERCIKKCTDAGLKMCGTVSTIWGSPISGATELQDAVDFTKRWLEIGASDIEDASANRMALRLLGREDCAGIALAFFIEYLDTSVKTIEDIEHFSRGAGQAATVGGQAHHEVGHAAQGEGRVEVGHHRDVLGAAVEHLAGVAAGVARVDHRDHDRRSAAGAAPGRRSARRSWRPCSRLRPGSSTSGS